MATASTAPPCYEGGVNFEEITDPLARVDQFRADAEASGQALPEAMTLATVGLNGRPRARVVLFKGREGRALRFYSNYRSDKAKELERNPFASLCIHFAALQLQVRIEGKVARLSSELSDEYFASRPRDSQIGAWASQQSQPLASRKVLDDAFENVAAGFRGQDIPRPPHWGGFALIAESVELWVGQSGRLHDRARYEFLDPGWRCTRLYP